MCIEGAKKSASVAQGAAEKLAPSVAADVLSKDSAKSESTGGGRLVDSSVQSDSVTPKSAMDSAKSDVTTKSSTSGQESTSHVNSMTNTSDPPFDVISLLNSGQTLRYRLGGFC